MASSPCRGQYTCTCVKCNFGEPHKVSKSTWYRHVKAAAEEEKLPSGEDHSVKTRTRRSDTMRAMIKRQLETVEEACHRIGRHKRARVQNSVSRLLLTVFQSLT